MVRSISLEDCVKLSSECSNMLTKATVNDERIALLKKRDAEIDKDLANIVKEYENLCKAATIIGMVSDDTTQSLLNKIAGLVNRALVILFPNKKREIKLVKKMYRDTYPHFIVSLSAEGGKERAFKCSGSGIAQVVSFIFTIALIEARGGRRVMVMDELLRGLHPQAKQLVHSLMLALSDRFQFIVIEYGLDIGKEYEVTNEHGISTVQEYPRNSYYADIAEEQSKVSSEDQ